MSEAPRHVHFVAIGGTGMGSLAGLLHARGIRVTGSDEKLYPPMSTLLEHWGIPVQQGFRAENVLEHPAGSRGDRQRGAREQPRGARGDRRGAPLPLVPGRALRARDRGQALGGDLRHARQDDHHQPGGGAAARHGARSLAAGRRHSLDFDGSFREGQGEHFVVEGDEYDTAFFDKTPKFLHYGARTLVVTSVEFDHADIYRDLEHVKQAFRTLVSRLPADGTLVAALDHEGVRDVIAEAPCRVVGYGLETRDAARLARERARRRRGGHALRRLSRRTLRRARARAAVRPRQRRERARRARHRRRARRAARGGGARARGLPRREAPPGGARRGARHHRDRRLRAPPHGRARDARRAARALSRSAAWSPSSSRAPTRAGASSSSATTRRPSRGRTGSWSRSCPTRRSTASPAR